MTKMILAVALLTAPVMADAKPKTKPPTGPIHCGPGYCDYIIRPWRQ